MDRRHRVRSVIAAVVVVCMSGALALIGPPAAAAPKARVSVELASTATLSPDGRSVTITVTASCARPWEVLEAFVTVSQTQAFGMGGLPLSCTRRPQTFTLVVQADEGTFEVGPAQVSAFVLVEHKSTTAQAQDTDVVQVVSGG